MSRILKHINMFMIIVEKLKYQRKKKILKGGRAKSHLLRGTTLRLKRQLPS